MKKLILAICCMCAAQAYAQHTLPPLPYAKNALEPVMSQETIEYHHGKHVQAYVDNLNRLIVGTPFANATLEDISKKADGGIFNNGAQIYNHQIFFDSFAPESSAKHAPTGSLMAAIDRDFGSFDNFKTQFAQSANGQFGSGWTWLVADAGGKLRIVSYSNAGNPLKEGQKPLLGVDVWEHSYYIDYRNKRADYVENLWRIVDWNVIEGRYAN